MSVSYLIIWYHCPVLTAFSPEMMTCILKAHYINLTSTQMRQLLGVYQFAELREEALVTTFFRIIVPLGWSSHDGSWCWVFSSQVLDQNGSMCPCYPRPKNSLTVLIRGLVSWLIKKFSSNIRISYCELAGSSQFSRSNFLMPRTFTMRRSSEFDMKNSLS